MQRYLDTFGGRLGGWTDQEQATFLRLRTRRGMKKENGKMCNHNPNPMSNDTRELSQSGEDETSVGGNQETVKAPRLDQLTVHVNAEDSDEDRRTERFSFYHEVAESLGTRSPEEVKQHDIWWTRLQELEMAKRKAIQQWKEKRLSVKLPAPDSNRSISTHRPTVPLTPEQLEAQKAALDQWREERRKLAETAAQEKNKAELEMRRANLKQLKKRRDELKECVAQYRGTKQTEQMEQARELAHQKEETRMLQRLRIAQSADRIKERNEHLIQEQIARKQAIQRAQEQRQIRIENALNQVGYVRTIPGTS
ncbi:unnamed protein product [Echinostoma caproni]|uniref:Coiled-coil domain-containing protein 112 n=1 Tax=Echinostoma caproni TaxID=27848 RepID=A0A183B089_9TREM|nr:unnamed protein product [Echinostoma caproni]